MTNFDHVIAVNLRGVATGMHQARSTRHAAMMPRRGVHPVHVQHGWCAGQVETHAYSVLGRNGHCLWTKSPKAAYTDVEDAKIN